VVLGVVFKDNRGLLFTIVGILAVVETASVMFVVSQLHKHAQCPNCGKALERDREQTGRGIAFPCTTCDTVWVSRIGGGSVDA